MKNGPYEMVVAPENYPGKKYRERYCYEHHLIWWLNHDYVPQKGEVIHHLNGNKRDNRLGNLELVNAADHNRQHTLERGRLFVELKCPRCNKVFQRRKSCTHLQNTRGFPATFCSRACSGHWHGSRRGEPPEQEVLREFKKYDHL